jgi:hypothetical protein
MFEYGLRSHQEICALFYLEYTERSPTARFTVSRVRPRRDMTFGGSVHRWKIVGRVHPSQNRGVQQINNQLIVTVTAILCCDWFCQATGIFCPRRFPPPNVISQTGLTLEL